MNFQNPDISVLMNKELYIFDMDGTIYLDDEVFPFAIRFIKNLRVAGKKVLFFTNNASHSHEFYIEKLTRLGFSPTKAEIMTSGDVTAEFLLRHRPQKTVYLLGTEDLASNFKNRGIHLLDGDEERADIVITSFDTTLTYHKMMNACRLIRGGAEYLSTHPDFNCPTKNGPIPDSGAIAAFVTASTGVSPTYFGKPYRQTVEMICEATGVDKDKMCIFGDRLYTDIAVGKHHGITAVLVYSGETQPEDVEKAEEADRPDFIFDSLDNVDGAMF
ncbi:MAG: HAD-IIA family hydrolase [Ruminococcaceae bacterium]|nr:HAD-IIA family hydrolase [Oscillospiraceae bacterium]